MHVVMLFVYYSLCRHACGNSSVGRAQASQAWGREFDSRFPLHAATVHRDVLLRNYSSLQLPRSLVISRCAPWVKESRMTNSLNFSSPGLCLGCNA